MENEVLLLFGQKPRQVLRTRKPSDNSGPLCVITQEGLKNMTIKIDHNKCLECGLCVEVCPNKILIKTDSAINYRNDRINLCFSCGQCMAICPSEAILVNNLSYDEDFYRLETKAEYENEFYNLESTRRSIRNFKDKLISKEVLQKVVDAIALAPPGFPPIKAEITLINNPEVMRSSLPHMISFYESLLKNFKNPIARIAIRKKIGKQKYISIKNHLIPLLVSRLPELKSGSENTITRDAPAMILFHANENEGDLTEDIFVAATYAMLAAHSLGLGSTIMSIIPPAIDMNVELRKLFKIPECNKVISSIILGYPKYKYKRGIKRTIRNVEWN